MRTGRESGLQRRAAPRESALRHSFWEAAVLAIAVAGGALCFQGAAEAQVPMTRSTSAPLPAVHDLAVDESLLHYCAHVDPKAALRLRIRLDRMERAASRGELDRLRATAEYRKTYEAVTKFTRQVDPHNARRMCGEGFHEPAAHGPVSEVHHDGG